MFVPRYFIRVEAAVQLGIVVPPLACLRPGLSEAPYKKFVL